MKFRLRDKHSAELCRQARAINFVWNYINETTKKSAKDGRNRLSGYDLEALTAGTSKDLGLSADSIKEVCRQHDRSRRQHKKRWLRFRGHKSLGWIPFKKHKVIFRDGSFVFRGQVYETMHKREIPSACDIHAGSFCADSRGRWYINVPVELPPGTFVESSGPAIGVDLGIKVLATLSTGEGIAAPQYFRRAQKRLGDAQRARKKRAVRKMSAKVADCRKDYLHKVSARIAARHAIVFVGDAANNQMTQTKLAKSVLDAGWSTLRKQLSYKAMRHGGRMIDVDESYSSRTCSECFALSGPKGIAGLGIREWTCSDCGAAHGRDTNAARNILARGLASLEEGAAMEAAQSTSLLALSGISNRRHANIVSASRI